MDIGIVVNILYIFFLCTVHNTPKYPHDIYYTASCRYGVFASCFEVEATLTGNTKQYSFT